MWGDRQIAEVSDERSITRGIAYADSGAVRLLSAEEHLVSAVVVGSESYRVALTPTRWDCTCPVGLEGWFCKHCVATALVARGSVGAPADPQRPIDLKELSREVTSLGCRRFLDWREATQWAREKSLVIADLEASVSRSGAVPLLQRAAERLTRTMEQADDSNGSIGELVLRVLDAHRLACDLNRPDPVALADWLLTFGIDDVDWWTLDVDRYVEALGPAGVERYRVGLAGRSRGSYAVQRAEQRMAVLDRDVDRAVRLFGGPLDLPVRYQRVAEALLDMEMPDLALAWAHRGLDETSGHQLHELYELTIRLDPTAELDLRIEQHLRMPSVSTYAALQQAAGPKWEGLMEQARDALGPTQLIDALLHDDDAPAAWTVATQSGEDVLPSQWRRLADRLSSHDPAATIPVYRRLVAETLTTAGAQNYRDAIALLKKLRSASHSAGDESFDDYLSQLRLDNRSRPTFQKMLKAARLV